MPSVERRLNERRVTDVGALGTQHSRDVTHLPGDRKICERHRDLILRALVPIVFLPSILHCDKADGVGMILSRHFRSLSLSLSRETRLCYRRSVSSIRKGKSGCRKSRQRRNLAETFSCEKCQTAVRCKVTVFSYGSVIT